MSNLSAEDERARHDFHLRVILESIVQGDHMRAFQQLSFIVMYAFYLHVDLIHCARLCLCSYNEIRRNRSSVVEENKYRFDALHIAQELLIVDLLS